MPRRTYDDRKGRRRPQDQRVLYSRNQIAALTDRFVKRLSDYTQGDPNR